MTNVFAPKPVDDSNPTPADSSPFGSGPSGSSSDGGFKLAPLPIGVLPGTVIELRQQGEKFVLDVRCDAPEYKSEDKISIWVGTDLRLLMQIAGSLGIACETRDDNVFFSDVDGNTSFSAFKNKTGLFIYCPYEMAPSINKFGAPKRGKSVEWDQYMEEVDFNAEQLAALKKAKGGVVPGDLKDLFT